jgi:hypothetical protein
MDALLFSLAIGATSLAVVFGLAFLMSVACLVAAAALPHGHPMANKLRSFPSFLSKSSWRLVTRLDALLFMAFLVVCMILTIYYA